MELFVGNISFRTEEDDLRDLFRSAGYAPDSLKLMTDRDTGKSRGFAFVTFNDAAAGRRAIEDLNGVNLMGRDLNVNEARGDRGGRGNGRRETVRR